MPPRKVLFVHTTSEVGGSDVSLVHIVERLDRARFQPLVALPSHGPLVARLERSGAEVFVLPRMKKLTSRKGRAWLAVFAANYPVGAWSLASLIRRHRVDLVHTNTIHNLYGWAAATIARRPHVWHVREIVWQSAALRTIERALASAFSSRVIVTSDAVGQMFERHGALPSHVTKIENGVDTVRFSPGGAGRIRSELGIAPGAMVVGAAARMDVWKGLEDFIEAAALVHGRRPDIRFVIAGGPIEGLEDYAAGLRALAVTRGLGGALIFTGWTYGPDAMPDFYRALDLFVLPSREAEPFGLVVLEAMASAKPVIATAHGGPLEIVASGETGVLVAPHDPQAMAAAILALAANPERARAMGAAGRARVAERYDISTTVTRLQTVYDEVLAG
ncbi:MAG: glycosyltransferase family 4 protein [Acidobacteriota bacterium]|nr:glycosyltransferase family 4 protein [Acidobacteriota bacterium]